MKKRIKDEDFGRAPGSWGLDSKGPQSKYKLSQYSIVVFFFQLTWMRKPKPEKDEGLIQKLEIDFSLSFNFSGRLN